MAFEDLYFEITETKGLVRVLIDEQKRQIPEVYINGNEVMRLLDISRPTLIQLVKDKIISETSKDENNRYLLAEILYLKGTRYKNLSVEDVEKLRQKKNEEFKPKQK